MKVHDQTWRSFLLTLDDDVFFDVIRNYLGPVSTPYNKHKLLERLVHYLQQEKIRKKILGNLSPEDVELLSSVDLLKTDDLHQIFMFFEGSSSAGEIYSRLLNLTDRLLIYRSPESGVLLVNPHLSQGLTAAGMGGSTLFPSTPAPPLRMAIPWVNDLLMLGSLSLLVDDDSLLKADGTIKKQAVKRFEDIFPQLKDGTESPVEMIVDTLRILGLMELNDSAVSLQPEVWADWADLPIADRHFLYWAAAIRSVLSARGSLNQSGERSRFIEFQEISSDAAILRQFLSSLESGRAYHRETLVRMLQIQSNGRGIFRRTGAVIRLCGELELISGGDNSYQPNPAIAGLLDAGLSEHRPAGPAIILHSDYRITVHPHGDFRRMLILAFAAEIREFDLLSVYEIGRSSVFRALGLGIPGAELLDAMDRLSDHHSPQNIMFSIKSWIEEFESVSVRSGYMLRCTEKSRAVIHLAAQHCPDAVVMSDDSVLFPHHELSWADELEKNGLHIRALLRLDSRRHEGGGGHFSTLPPLVPRHSNAPAYGSAVVTSSKPLSEPEVPTGEAIKQSEKIDRKSLRAFIEDLGLSEDIEKELLLRVNNGLILEEHQINAGIVRPDITEARGLNYTAKLRLIEMALDKQDILEFFPSGQERPLLLKPVKIHRKAGRSSDLLEAKSIAGNEELTIPIAKGRLIRRLKGSLFHRV